MGPDTEANARLAALFGADRAFSATAVMTVKSTSRKRPSTPVMEMAFASLAGKVRTEIDMTRAAMSGGDEASRGQMAAMGMGRMVSITRPDLGKSFLIYPGLKAYCEMPLTGGAAGQDAGKPPKIDKKEVGRETIDGHPCIKHEVTVTGTDGRSFTSLVWEATDLKGFPIQTQVTTADGEVTTRFKDIKTAKPDAALFEPPAGFQRHVSMQEMMMGAMRKRMMGGE
jgi:hypothetical protein